MIYSVPIVLAFKFTELAFRCVFNCNQKNQVDSIILLPLHRIILTIHCMLSFNILEPKLLANVCVRSFLLLFIMFTHFSVIVTDFVIKINVNLFLWVHMLS